MTRFLLTTLPIPGHVNPMLPIARELLARGHEVAWYTGRLFRPAVESCGARYLPMKAAPDLDLSDPSVLPERHRLRGVAQLKYYLKHMLLDGAAGQMADLAEILRSFPAAAVLSDYTLLGSLYTAERGGPPCALLGIAPYPQLSRDTAPYGLGWQPGSTTLGRLRNRALNLWVGRVAFAGVNRYARRARQKLGLSPTRFPFIDTGPRLADLYLQTTAGSFEYPRSDITPHFRYIGPLIPPPAAEFSPPAWWPELAAGLPVVHVTQGTVATDHRQLLVPALRALADEPVLVVAATGGKPVAELPIDRLPANARVEPFVPYGALFPHVDAVVTNAGYGGVQYALAHGIPLVAAGSTEDKREVSARIEWSGVGIALRRESPRPEAIRRAVRRLLDEPRFRAEARRVQKDLARYDAPRRAADLLEELAAAGSPRGRGRPGPETGEPNVSYIFPCTDEHIDKNSLDEPSPAGPMKPRKSAETR